MSPYAPYPETESLSVCVPVGPGERWLDETLASLENQLPRYQLVVYEDTEGNGAGWARNQAFKQARGSYILKLDADDLLTPGLLARLWEKKGPNGIVCPGAAQFFDAEGWKHRWAYENITHDQAITRIQSPASSAGCLLYHRNLHGQGWPEDCGAYESWVFLVERITAGAWLLPVPDTYYLHRLHPGSYWDSSTPTRREELHRAMLRTNEVYAEAWA